jgi:Flp pilus assembly protein TadB
MMLVFQIALGIVLAVVLLAVLAIFVAPATWWWTLVKQRRQERLRGYQAQLEDAEWQEKNQRRWRGYDD